jgi:hypothetical protein
MKYKNILNKRIHLPDINVSFEINETKELTVDQTKSESLRIFVQNGFLEEVKEASKEVVTAPVVTAGEPVPIDNSTAVTPKVEATKPPEVSTSVQDVVTTGVAEHRKVEGVVYAGDNDSLGTLISNPDPTNPIGGQERKVTEVIKDAATIIKNSIFDSMQDTVYTPNKEKTPKIIAEWNDLIHAKKKIEILKSEDVEWLKTIKNFDTNKYVHALIDQRLNEIGKKKGAKK